MPEISEQDFAALAAQVASLSSALAVARRRIDDLEDGMTGHLGLDWGESLIDVNSPHPNISANTIESGGGIIRQDANGMQVEWDSTTESTGVVFTDRFTDDPLTHAPTGGLRGRVDTDAGIAVSQIFAAYTDTELASYVTAANGPVANVIDLHARDSSTSEFGRFIIYANLPYANLTGVAYKSSLSADPDSGSLVEGMFWYNTTNDAFKGYRGSSKLEFLMEGDASGMNKVTGSGYLVMPAAATGIDPANSGSAWTNGAYSEVVASTSEARSIIGFIWEGEQAAQDAFEGEIDIATGGAGAETVVATIPVIQVTGAASSLGGDNISNPTFFPAVIEVATTTRVAVRQRSSNTSREARNIRLIYVKASELEART